MGNSACKMEADKAGGKCGACCALPVVFIQTSVCVLTLYGVCGDAASLHSVSDADHGSVSDRCFLSQNTKEMEASGRICAA